MQFNFIFRNVNRFSIHLFHVFCQYFNLFLADFHFFFLSFVFHFPPSSSFSQLELTKMKTSNERNETKQNEWNRMDEKLFVLSYSDSELNYVIIDVTTYTYINVNSVRCVPRINSQRGFFFYWTCFVYCKWHNEWNSIFLSFIANWRTEIQF